jgi:methionyl-tRNA formyltransferase
MPASVRIVFMGTAELSCDSLRALTRNPEFQVVAVVTQPDRPKGRALKLQPSPVKTEALRAGLAVLQPERARALEFIEQVRMLAPDLIAVAAYGQVLPQALLDVPRFGCLNVHTSLLPKYRGAAPIQWAILNGESETGVTIMKMDAGLDTGDIVAEECTRIQPADDSVTLHARLGRMGAELLVRTIPDYVSGKLKLQPQPVAGVSLAPKIRKQDGEIDWRQPATVIWNRVRGLVPWPGAFTHLPGDPKPHLLKIWRAEIAQRTGPAGEVLESSRAGLIVGCGVQALKLLEVQVEGGRRLAAEQFLAGHKVPPGQHLN